MGQLAFDLSEQTPDWAETCFYCSPDALGRYNERNHFHSHLPMTCTICRASCPNRLQFENSHGVNLGASFTLGVMVCSSLSLQLNHLSYALRHGELPSVNDVGALKLHWLIAPDGTQLPPKGWPLLPTPLPRGGIAQACTIRS